MFDEILENKLAALKLRSEKFENHGCQISSHFEEVNEQKMEMDSLVRVVIATNSLWQQDFTVNITSTCAFDSNDVYFCRELKCQTLC